MKVGKGVTKLSKKTLGGVGVAAGDLMLSSFCLFCDSSGDLSSGAASSAGGSKKGIGNSSAPVRTAL